MRVSLATAVSLVAAVLLTTVAVVGCTASHEPGAVAVTPPDAGAPSTWSARPSLGGALRYAILAERGVTTAPGSQIRGDIGVSPATSSFVAGFGLAPDPSGAFATSTAQISGHVFAADFTEPTRSELRAAIVRMEDAFADGASRTPDVTELGGGTLDAVTVAPGVHRWSGSAHVAREVIVFGGPDDVWIFQVAGDLTASPRADVFLTGGVLAKNVFWIVDGDVELGAGAHFEGVVLSRGAITFRAGASVHGRLFSQATVAIDASIVVAPAQ